MIASKKLHQNLSDYNQFYLKKVLKLIKTRFLSQIQNENKKWEIQVHEYMIMFTRSSERIFSLMRCSGNILS